MSPLLATFGSCAAQFTACRCHSALRKLRAEAERTNTYILNSQTSQTPFKVADLASLPVFMLGLTPHYQPSIAATVPRFGTLVHRAMLYCAYPSIMSHAVQAYVKIYPPRYALVRWSTEHSFIVLIHLSCHRQYKRMSKFILLVSEKEKKWQLWHLCKSTQNTLDHTNAVYEMWYRQALDLLRAAFSVELR